MVINADFAQRDDEARARPPPPPLDRREDREEEVLLLDVHDVPRHRRAVRRPAAPHDSLREDYAANLADIEKRHVLSDDPSFYVQNACVTDDSLAPQGCSTLYVLAPVTHQHANVDWSKETPRSARAC